MALTSYTYVGQAVISEPDGTLNSGSELDNAIRMDRTAQTSTWPNITGPVAATHQHLTSNAVVTTAGTSTAYTATISPGGAFTAYTANMGLIIKPNVASGAAPTINVNALGAKSIIHPDGSAVSANELLTTSYYQLIYNGTSFVVTNLGSGSSLVLDPRSATAAQILIGSTTNSTTPVIDFNSSTTATTYDVRLAASGGTASAGAGTLTITAATTAVSNAATVGGTLGVTGATTLAGLSATTGTFSSTLGVTGATTLAGLSATTGSFSSTLGVTGTTTLGTANITTAAVSGNATVGGTLGVTGTTTLGTANVTTATITTANITNVGGSAASGVAKMWCYFSGTATGTNAPTAGYNVTSITRIGVGQYDINFGITLSSANYCIQGTSAFGVVNPVNGTLTTTKCRVNVQGFDYTNGDPTYCHVVIYAN